MPKTVFITGANRGIGLEFVKQYAEKGWNVIATCRNPKRASALKELARAHTRVEIHTLDVTHNDEIAQLDKQLGKRPIDVVINNAGILGDYQSTIHNCQVEEMLLVYRTNAVSAIPLVNALLENLMVGTDKKILMISSEMASISDNHNSGAYAYRASKAALNMIGKNMSIDLQPDGITVLMMCPGWVQTDMGGNEATTPVEESVQGMISWVEQATIEQTGSFTDYKHQALEW